MSDTMNESPCAADDGLEPAFTSVPLTTMRRAIARRLVESKQQAPHFYVSVDVDLDALVTARKQWKLVQGDAAPSVNDCIIKAAAAALTAVPQLNASLDGERVRQYQSVNIGVAVALRGGLVVPVIRDVGRLGLAEIAQASRELAERARTNKLTPDDYRGGTFTISNLGMLGVRQFIAILNPPQAGILALGEAAPRAIVRDGTVLPSVQMTATLSVDHRVVDGSVAAEFLRSFRTSLEQPSTLLEGNPQ
jgi:pyruvate dehydrogenase E2 component (dihydrolipoamide acetyltransferase)